MGGKYEFVDSQCSNCRGTGSVTSRTERCSRCNGKGWVEGIFGKKDCSSCVNGTKYYTKSCSSCNGKGSKTEKRWKEDPPSRSHHW